MAAEGRQQLLAGCKFGTTVALNPSWVFFLGAFIKKGTLGCSSPSPFICAVKRGGICEQPLAGSLWQQPGHPGCLRSVCGVELVSSRVGLWFVSSLQVLHFSHFLLSLTSAAVCRWGALFTSGPSSVWGQ